MHGVNKEKWTTKIKYLELPQTYWLSHSLCVSAIRSIKALEMVQKRVWSKPWEEEFICKSGWRDCDFSL